VDLTVNPAKMAEPMEMPCGMVTVMVSRNSVLDGGPDFPGRGFFFFGKSDYLLELLN